MGNALIEQSNRVKFSTGAGLLQQLQKAREELILADALKKTG
jgi:hypothetical protein